MPLLTVTTNAYNGMPYLPQAVDSILGQSYRDWKFVIVNDGSTDGTHEYLNSLRDSRIQIIHQENQGTAAASNRVIAACDTKYIVRMDADDVSLPERLQVLLDYMESRPEVGMAGSQAVWFGEQGKSKNLKLPTSHDAIRKALMSCFHAIVHPTVIQRTDVIRGIGGYWKYRQYDDEIDMMLRMTEASKVVNLDQVLYHYRIVPNSLSGSSPTRIYFSYNYSIELAKRREKGLPPITPEEYQASLDQRGWLQKIAANNEMYARTQYRKAVYEKFSNRSTIAYARTAWAALWAPHLTLQRVKRMLRPGLSEN